MRRWLTVLMTFFVIFSVSGMQGRLGFVIGDPTGVNYYIPYSNGAIDVQAGFSYYWIGYLRLSAGYEMDIAKFDVIEELPGLVFYGRGALAGELGIFPGYDLLKMGGEARIGFKFTYNNKYEFFVESGPCLWILMHPYLDWGGVIGVRIYK